MTTCVDFESAGKTLKSIKIVKFKSNFLPPDCWRMGIRGGGTREVQRAKILS